MTAPNSKPPFLRRRWPYFVLGFLAAVPAPRLGWLAIERFWYGGPTTLVSVIEIDRDFAGPRLRDRKVDGFQEWIRMSDGKTIVWDRVRTASPSVTIEFRYVDEANRTTREGRATIGNLDPKWRECLILIRHYAEHTDIQSCLPGVPGL